MPTKLMTPGVYIEEKNAFPSSAVAVETAVPVFIGYTEKAEWNGKSLIEKPTRITSFAEYVERFGAGFNAKFTLADADPAAKQETFALDGKQMVVEITKNHTFYLFNSIRLFYANGGGPCYILSVDTYKDKKDGLEIKAEDFIGSATKSDPFEILKKEFEPTLVLVPDAIALGEECYSSIYTKILAHCAKMQSRFGIFDLVKQLPSDETSNVVGAFRDNIGMNDLKYGAAYYPWLKTSIVQPSEVTFESLDDTVDLSTILPATEVAALGVVKNFKAKTTPDDNDKLNYHQALKATSPTYNNILEEVRAKLNELPAAPAMAGLYTAVDNSRGVWKSPANVSVSMVNAPTVNISHEQQEDLNVDVLAGKSINVIRSFPGIGTLVWGGRTLDGNSQDWRYINVRRTLIMIEQSLKLATRAYVFEPNDANTWITVKCMIMNFLTNLWKQGALAGSVPEQAFDVQIGLGTTMTPTDILDGKMLITVKVAIVRPAEFIVITFQQQMQQS
ncbi:MAG: phage tail sheath C-terminal domain-containing protein [Bacteroidota bacterium]|nr:phage tail sheath C-terminal domain-containing protein [Bacteroidota bacterium]